MSYQFSALYDNITNLDYSQTEIIATNGALATLNNSGLTFSQDFSSDSGFTYDSSKSEFTGGLVRQKDTRPSNATFLASYNVNKDGNGGGGTLTGTLNGGATVHDGVLDLASGTVKYEDFSATGNAGSQQTLCIRKVIIPNFTGAPATSQFYVNISQAPTVANNMVAVYHTSGSTNITIRIKDSAGADIIFTSAGSYSPTSGVPFEIELNMDLTSGATRLFINGTQLGSTITTTGTRGSSIGLLRIGSDYNGTVASNFKTDSLLIFSTVQHTSNYTPDWSNIYENIYVENKVDLPNFSYSGPKTLITLDSFSTTETDSPKFILNDKYWNGSSWATSDGSYLQANDKATILANIGSLSVTGTTSITCSVVFQNSHTQSSVDLLTITYTGQKYYLSGWLRTKSYFTAEELTLLAKTTTEPANTLVKYAIMVDGILKYWNGSAWAVSDGTESKTNTLSEINTNIATIVTTNSTVKFYVLLITTDNQVTPNIELATIDYDFAGDIAEPETCIVYGYYRDLSGNGINDATVTFTLKRNKYEYKEAADSVIEKAVSVTTGSNGDPDWEDGYFEIELIKSKEFEGTGEYYLSVEKENDTLKTNKDSTGALIEFEVPDATEKNITDILTAA